MSFNEKKYSTETVTTKAQREVFNKIWQKIWLEENYASPEEIVKVIEHYKNYDETSVDFLLKIDTQAVGTVRLILDSKEGLPVLNDFKISVEGERIIKNSGEKKMEITLLTIVKDQRKKQHRASMELMKACYNYAMTNNYLGAFFAADYRLYFLLKKLGFPIIQIGEEKEYEGSLTYPTYLEVKAAMSFLKNAN